MEEKEVDVFEQVAFSGCLSCFQNYKLALVQSELTAAQSKKEALVAFLRQLDADYAAKVQQRDELQKEYNQKHNAFCALVERLEALHLNRVNFAGL